VAQAIECLLCRYEAVSSNPSPIKKKNPDVQKQFKAKNKSLIPTLWRHSEVQAIILTLYIRRPDINMQKKQLKS
jgi:hypothetical protein